MSRKQKRLSVIGAIGSVLLAAVLLVMFALKDEIVFFYSPSDVVVEQKARPGERFRLGGLVKKQSIEKKGEEIRFVITDNEKELPVLFIGILPDLFREGQGVIAEGTMRDDVFSADTVLAKHDENYMPKEVADTLKKKGLWQEGVAQ